MKFQQFSGSMQRIIINNKHQQSNGWESLFYSTSLLNINKIMSSPRHTEYNTISHPSEGLKANRKSHFQRYNQSSSSYDSHSIQYPNTRPKELERIARSFNVRTYHPLEKSVNLDQRKKSLNVNKTKNLFSENDHNDKIKPLKKPTRQIPEISDSLSIDMLRGEGYNNRHNRLHRRSYVKTIVPVEGVRGKRVVPIEFEEQLKQANRSFVKQNLYDWMRHKREDILNKVSEQIKLKSEFQKFLPN